MILGKPTKVVRTKLMKSNIIQKCLDSKNNKTLIRINCATMIRTLKVRRWTLKRRTTKKKKVQTMMTKVKYAVVVIQTMTIRPSKMHRRSRPISTHQLTRRIGRAF